MSPTVLAILVLIVAGLWLLALLFGRKRPLIIRDHSEGRRPEVWNAAASRSSRHRRIDGDSQAQPSFTDRDRSRSRSQPWGTPQPPTRTPTGPHRAEGLDVRWYDITPVVVVLLFFLWPVGLYGLLMSRTISRRWKIAVTSVYGTLLLVGVAAMNMPVLATLTGIAERY